MSMILSIILLGRCVIIKQEQQASNSLTHNNINGHRLCNDTGNFCCQIDFFNTIDKN